MEEIAKYANVKLTVGKNIQNVFQDKIVPSLVSKFQTKNLETFKDYIYTILENVALENNIERYNIYTFDEFISKIKEKEENIKNKATKLLIHCL